MLKFVIAMALVTAGGLALLAWDADAPVPAVRAPQRVANVPAMIASKSDAPTEVAPDDTPEARTDPAVVHKYRYLLADLDMPDAQRTRVLELLARREALAKKAAPDLEASRPPDAAIARQMAAIDVELRGALPPAAFASYELFRDSDTEQTQLEQYTGGIRLYAPLGAEQERAVLEAKLRQKREYSRLVRDAGLERPSLSLAEREHAMSTVERSLNEYRLAYLNEVAPLLDERQYALLSNYEATEFRLELERLQQIINTR